MQRRIEHNGKARYLRERIAQTQDALYGPTAHQTQASDDPKVGP